MDYVFKYTQGFLLMNISSSEISIFPAIVLNYIEIIGSTRCAGTS